MKGILIPVNGWPREVDIQPEKDGGTLHSLQQLVGGSIEPFDVVFDGDISLYVNEEGLFTCPPNRAVYATRHMEEVGYLSQMDYASAVKEGELYTILCGNVVAVGFDPVEGRNRDLTAAEAAQVTDYFSKVSRPGSGLHEVLRIKYGSRDGDRDAERGVSLGSEAKAAQEASTELEGPSGAELDAERQER